LESFTYIQPYNDTEFIEETLGETPLKVQKFTMETNGKDDLKTQFVTREGCYRLLNLSEYSRPNRVGYQSNQNSPQVRVSFVSLPVSCSSQQQQQQQSTEKGKKSDENIFILL
jgi:hypothetical protein